MSGREIEADDGLTGTMMANPRFVTLCRTRRNVALALTAVILVLYYGFVALVAFDKGLLSTVVAGKQTSLGIVLGFALLLVTFVLVAIYVAIANSRFDALTAEVRREVGR